ncbi:MAG: glycosyltransferase [Prevotella sp.]|nr:glycosyltransferase [Prevotella sp.]
MEGLVIWAYSYCRSTLAFYNELGKTWGIPTRLIIWKEISKARITTGFNENEFDDISLTYLGNDYSKAISILYKHKTWNHIWGAYQSVPIYQKLILEAKKLGCSIGIASESPCNMSHGAHRILKYIYINYLLKYKVKKQIDSSDFIINFSGNDSRLLEKIGWPKEKIIPCGYYPPKITGSTEKKRDEDNWNDFSILLTGKHEWHRSPILLLKALKILSKKGCYPKCIITQDGPQLDFLRKYAKNNKLKNVEFLGFVTLNKLIELYEKCSVYIGTGNNEPWGMRLNDALNCGSPLIVNEGMGGVKLIEDYNCGLSFKENDYVDLAKKIELLMANKEMYLEISNNAFAAINNISPKNKAAEITDYIKDNFYNWK